MSAILAAASLDLGLDRLDAHGIGLWALFLGLGIAAAVVNIAGGGGSLFVLPVLMSLGLPAHVANATNRFPIVIQNLSGAAGFHRRGVRPWALWPWVLPSSVVGSVLGQQATHLFDPRDFQQVLIALVLAFLVLLIWNPGAKRWKASAGALEAREPGDHGPPGATNPLVIADPLELAMRIPGAASSSLAPLSARQKTITALLFLAIGFFGGFVQAGVGYLVMAALIGVLRLDLVRTNALKVLVIAVFTVPALALFMLDDLVRWPVALALAVGNGLGGYFAPRLVIAVGERALRLFLVVTVLVTAFKLVVLDGG